MRKPRRTVAALLATTCVAAASLVLASNHASATAALRVTTSAVPTGRAIEKFSDRLTATGGVKPYTWSLTEGYLSEGLTMTPHGVIRGRPHIAGIFHFTVQVRDALLHTATRSLTMTVEPACPAGTFPSELYGLPGLQPRHSLIVYIWAEANGVMHLSGTHANPVPMRLTGSVTTTGRFGRVWAYSERQHPTDAPMGTVNIKVNAARTRVSYANRNFGGADGLDFTVTCTGTLTFDLYADGKHLGAERIALGKGNAPAHPPANPFHFRLPASTQGSGVGAAPPECGRSTNGPALVHAIPHVCQLAR